MPQQPWEHLRPRYPSWSIRPTAGGAILIATRLGRTHLTPDELAAGLAMTLVEDTPDALTEALAAQTELEEAL